MSITLNETLKTAQDGKAHNPIIEIISYGLTDDIPFDGQFLTHETTNEQKPNIILHSSGKLVFVYNYGTASLEFVTTDAGKTEFSHVNLSRTSLGCSSIETILEASLCEMSDTNIGIVFITSDTSNYYLRRAIITISGTVNSTGQIASYLKSSYSLIKSPFVIILSDDSYYLVYILDDSSYLSKVYKRTSSDFITWSSEAEISISGLSTNTKENVSIFLLDNDDIFLMLDYYDDTNYSNCYYSISTDDGSTWGAASALTSYDTASASGKHPVMYQVDSDTVFIVYYEESESLCMTKDTDGMPSEMAAVGLTISDITIDPDTSRAYLVISYLYSGYKELYGVVEIDIETWEVLNYWDYESTPAYPSAFQNKHIWWMSHTGYKDLIPVAITRDPNYRHIAVLDASEDTITYYNFSNHAGDLALNISWMSWGSFGSQTKYKIDLTYIDSNSRLWVVHIHSYVYGSSIDILYINLTEEPSEGRYNHYQVVRDSSVSQYQAAATKCIQIDTTNQYIYLSMIGTESYAGRLKIYDITKETSYIDKTDFPLNLTDHVVPISTGLVIGDFSGMGSGVPYRGLKRFILGDNKIWGIFDTYSGESNYRGLCEIITVKEGDYIKITETNYYRPSWGSYDDYLFHDLKFASDGKILISSYYGVTLFDPETKEWELFDNANYPGFTSDGNDNFFTLAYDSSTNMVLTGRAGVSSVNDLVGFSLDGPMKKTYYKEGSYSGGWSFGSASEMIEEYNDYEAVPVIDTSDSSLFLFWTKRTLSELSIKWDHDLGQLNLVSYLLRSTEVILSWNIDNLPAEISFGLSSGHLFDPHNVNSLISRFLTKERKITIRIGETVSDTEYWQNQGSYMIKSIVLSDYERGKYPTVSVICKDLLDLLEETNVITTDYYDTDAESVIEDILEVNAEVDSGDIDNFTFTNSETIYCQYLDSNVLTIISEICDRFGYFMIIDMDGIFTCRKITDSASVSHTYSNKDDLVKWSPQDKYSDWTNRIIVVGEERDYNEIIYPEEMILTKSGTTGWWAGGEKIACYYSEDKTKKCYFPRLVWESKPTGFGLWRDNLNPYIEEMNDQLGCYLIIDAPNLVTYLLTLIALITTKWAIPDGVGSGSTIPIGRLAEGTLLLAIMDVLTAATNWQATIYAKPVGYARRTVQAIADDTMHQTKINKTIKYKIEEPLCYTVAQCQEVADYELMLKQLNRKKVSFTKIMHLQDEVGDTISILHPFSGQSLNVYITNLTRRYKMSDTTKEKGHCFDDIEGFIL